VGEAGLRYFTAFPIYGERNLQPHRLLGYTLSTNLSDVDRDGFRNPSGVSTKIIAIGDSHTQGYNVKYEDSWPAKFSSKIQKPVYNFGVGGYGVLHYGVILANLPVNTNEIILGLYIANDFDYFTTPQSQCITELGRESIEREFKIPVPTCEYKEHYKGIRTRLMENYMIDRYRGKDVLKKTECR